MSVIRSSSSALLLIGGVATLPGAASVRSQFQQSTSAWQAADAELGYMQQPIGPATPKTTSRVASTPARRRSQNLAPLFLRNNFLKKKLENQNFQLLRTRLRSLAPLFLRNNFLKKKLENQNFQLLRTRLRSLAPLLRPKNLVEKQLKNRNLQLLIRQRPQNLAPLLLRNNFHKKKLENQNLHLLPTRPRNPVPPFRRKHHNLRHNILAFAATPPTRYFLRPPDKPSQGVNQPQPKKTGSGIRSGPKSKPRSPISPDDTVTAKMTSWVQVATTPTADTGPSLVLHFDHRRYLFGHLSEGTQRALNQRKYSMAKLETLFLSGPSTWRHTGGMVGMLLTLADVLEGSRKSVQEHNDARKKMGKSLLEDKGPERLEIHGGRHLTHSIATSRNFIFRKGMPIRAVELDEETRSAAHDLSKPDWEDDAIQVWKVPVVAAEQNSRKRSFDVMNTSDDNSDEDSDANSGANNGETFPYSVAQKKIDKEAVAAVVEQMFSSDWTMDTLAETKLHDVRLPATIFVRRDGQISKYTGPMPGGDEDVPNIDVLVRIPWPATKVRFLPKLADPANMSVCYVVKNRGRRGKFNPKVAKQHGVQPTDFKRLTSGQTVTGADGVEVTPEMVLAPPEKPSGFAVIDIPGVSSIESFLQRYEWKDAELMNNVLVFYWLLGKSVVDDSRIQAFMKGRPEVKHVVLAPDACSNMIAFESYAILLAKLRRIDADRFPLLGFDNTTRDLSFIGPNVETAGVGMKAYLTPYLAKDQKSVAAREQALLPPPTFEEVETMPQEVLALADQARMRVKDPKFLAAVERAEKDIPNRDTEIIPLGTGSALPSKYRNVSGTLIRVPKYGNYLLDCGENTLGQLRRAFNAQEVESILRDLRCVFISHMHADHHLGLVTLLQAWDDATANIDPPPQLTIICPAMMKNFLHESKYLQRLATDRMVFPRAQWSDAIIARDLPPGDPSMLSSFSQVPVVHCHQAFAVVLTWPSGLKIAFSGDCRPSDNLVKAGMGATLLVHESTFNDDKLGDAKAKKHSTMGEALDVAYRMGARRVLLTHFSQRYAKMPLLEERKTANGADQAVLVAFDQMRVKLGEFRQAMEFLPAISRLIEIEDAKDSKQTGEDA
ncbi:Ribonuclease Z 1 [Colletotrichum trifolii]|uniref:ribonuclease Z n=1 Tax=Colletotrichum trifolii TaxID=5466 RepID=A0A4R8RCR2_COLTR|nr:Ribonuclease Z 1 [Colletotrichum trifolii]